MPAIQTPGLLFTVAAEKILSFNLPPQRGESLSPRLGAQPQGWDILFTLLLVHPKSLDFTKFLSLMLNFSILLQQVTSKCSFKQFLLLFVILRRSRCVLVTSIPPSCLPLNVFR